MHIENYSERITEAALRAGFRQTAYGRQGTVDLAVLERSAQDETAPAIYISAGVHGNEPAPPMAVLELLRRDALPRDAHYTIFPLINPDGLCAGTRENATGIDLNRDYGLQPLAPETRAQLDWIGQRQFHLALCLHEDDDGEGFYLYSHNVDPDAPDYPGIAIEAARPFCGVDGRSLIDDMPARDGRMFPPESILDRNRADLPEALRLFFHHGTQVTITTETPSRMAITSRIAAQCAAVLAILEAFLDRHRRARIGH